MGSVKHHAGEVFVAGEAATADDGAQVVRVHPHLQPLATATIDHAHPDVVRVVDDAANEVFEGVSQQTHASSLVASASALGFASASAFCFASAPWVRIPFGK